MPGIDSRPSPHLCRNPWSTSPACPLHFHLESPSSPDSALLPPGNNRALVIVIASFPSFFNFLRILRILEYFVKERHDFEMSRKLRKLRTEEVQTRCNCGMTASSYSLKAHWRRTRRQSDDLGAMLDDRGGRRGRARMDGPASFPSNRRIVCFHHAQEYSV